MSDQSSHPLDVSRRRLLNLFGATIAAGLAGCSGLGGDSGNGSTPVDRTDERPEDTPEEENTPEDTTTSEAKAEHVPTGQLAEEWLQDPPQGDKYPNVVIFDSYSPSRLHNAIGMTLEGMTAAESAYDRLPGFSPQDIPETFYQLTTLPSTIKVDQLPGHISVGRMGEILHEGGYAEVSSVGNFDVYARSGDQSAHAVGEGRFVSSMNMFTPVHRTGAESHRNDLEQALRRYSDDSMSNNFEQLKDVLGPKDSFGGIENQNLDLVPSWTGDGQLIGSLEGPRPEYAGISVDIEEGKKYGAWIFESTEQARELSETLNSGAADVRSGWKDFDYQRNVMTAEADTAIEERMRSQEAYSEAFIAQPWF